MMAGHSSKMRHVRCPTCGKQALYSADNPSRPFCSVRCRNADLGAWASAGYRVAADPPPDAGESRPEIDTAH